MSENEETTMERTNSYGPKLDAILVDVDPEKAAQIRKVFDAAIGEAYDHGAADAEDIHNEM